VCQTDRQTDSHLSTAKTAHTHSVARVKRKEPEYIFQCTAPLQLRLRNKYDDDDDATPWMVTEWQQQQQQQQLYPMTTAYNNNAKVFLASRRINISRIS